METAARPLAQVLPSLRVVEAVSPSPQGSSEELSRLNLAALPKRLNDKMLARLEAMTACHIPPPAPCPEPEFYAILAGLQACLPSQSRSDVSLEAQAEGYRRMLGGYSLAAMKHLETEALNRCEWFPTIKVCLDILKGFPVRNPLAAKRSDVLRRISAEHTTRFDEAMFRLIADDEVPQDWIDALPETWKQMAETRSLLRLEDDGRYTLRQSAARELAAARMARKRG